MAKSEPNNTHLHKVLTHRNYMHNVSLQKQLNIYDKQRKLVEKELQEITKVREAIQQINRTFNKKSPTITKRESRSISLVKKSNSDPSLLAKSGKIVKDTCPQEVDGIGNGENSSNVDNVYQTKNEIRKSSSAESLQTKNKEDVGGILPQCRKFETTAESPGVNSRLDKVAAVNSNHSSTRLEQPDTLNAEKQRKITAENEDGRTKSQFTQGNEKLFTRRRPLYVKSNSASSLPVQKLDDLKVEDQCEIYRLPRHSPRSVFEERSSKSDEDLYKKTLLSNHGSGISGLPSLCTQQNKGILTGQHGKLTEQRGNGLHEDFVMEKQKQYVQSPTILRAFNNSDFCLLHRTRPSGKTVCDVETSRTKSSWQKFSPDRQRQTRTVHFFNTMQNSDASRFVEKPRARSKTVSETDNPFSEYGRTRSKTESSSSSSSPALQRRLHRDLASSTSGIPDRSQNNESVRFSEDETIAIKGKFRQIGHSVLAIALMKKMSKNS